MKIYTLFCCFSCFGLVFAFHKRKSPKKREWELREFSLVDARARVHIWKIILNKTEKKQKSFAILSGDRQSGVPFLTTTELVFHHDYGDYKSHTLLFSFRSSLQGWLLRIFRRFGQSPSTENHKPWRNNSSSCGGKNKSAMSRREPR